ncbi:hypothetical protein A3A71_03080 [Candidatus Berkelbacteria bacterium RIFCSPLOWO2_01_FULL_50_28]|uniref:Uncharacterized protein n=1 Tax=Candidatus Berkelbacteria bacterium RIFCSPLOWO2_01_FULL_50_28 TaxID=1797471 RepID=A0A1F5ECA9_9BACT|nr:MAG: hypothetical protein A2807_02645 [Candidatus Berkelbacteria bacterium RIFCSPHIGHO2_01_FULL_50_36]OGD63775.1 MAG: hypothetical protein A3F39_03480 [Candidatus Berkelbacteria bacterium RIFCSPHIGHO2_12_FULL_50_11]OGD65048.1 MAG: hypothetical protein A3A71_03080 [Candidatus Berkelbacteria bacterium RIFCSPLOWO2_01_FULL_50_28]
MDEQQTAQSSQETVAPATQPTPVAAPVTPVTGTDAPYGGKKGSWATWLLLYVVIAAIAYGVIWYFWLNK